MPLEKLTRARIIQTLNLLGELAEKEEVNLELCIFGGTAMLLAYGARESTKDINVILHPSQIARTLAARVGEQLGLDSNWLNEDVRRFVSEQGTFAPLEIQELETAAKRRLRISRPSASYLLAMKCLAGRSALPGFAGDIEDIRFLIRKLGIRSIEEVEHHMDRFHPHGPRKHSWKCGCGCCATPRPRLRTKTSSSSSRPSRWCSRLYSF